MKVFLMHRDRDVDLHRGPPPGSDALIADLELNTLWNAMAAGDKYLFEVARRAVLSSLTDPGEIVYRQHVLADCLAQPDIVREIYQLAVEAIDGERKNFWGLFRASPESVLHRSVSVLEFFVSLLKRLRQIAGAHAAGVGSEGFTRLFAMLAGELSDGYFQRVEEHLSQLKFRGGVLISAQLGQANKGTGYVLRRPRPQGWLQRIGSRSGYSFVIPERDMNGFRALSDLRDRGINLVANATGQSADHILSFFQMLRAELGFYVGCLNLHERLTGKGEPVCFPVPVPVGGTVLSARGLYDPCLSLTIGSQVVGNDVNAGGKRLVVITGANQGGKSTFLRATGLAQLMMQCGMFAAAQSFRADVRAGVFTHYKREEDAAMESGKLDEELARMNGIAAAITPGGMLLCNESFASTDEKEGSEIARQIVRALTEAGIKVLYVTHLFDLAHGFHREAAGTALFLRAERQPGGRRTFKLSEGEPLPTSYGQDLYERIFHAATGAQAAQVGSRE